MAFFCRKKLNHHSTGISTSRPQLKFSYSNGILEPQLLSSGFQAIFLPMKQIFFEYDTTVVLWSCSQEYICSILLSSEGVFQDCHNLELAINEAT